MTSKCAIQHMIVTGGGPIGFVNYGIIRSAVKRGALRGADIQSYHGISAGGIVCAMICCGIDWVDLDDYIIGRPWEELLYVSPERLFAAFSNTGVFGDDIIQDMMNPLLQSVGLDVDITLMEFHAATGKTLVLYAHDVNSDGMDLCALSHITYPDMKLVTAIRATCALPPIIRPVVVGYQHMIDGGFVTNVPVNAGVDFVRRYLDDTVDINSFFVIRTVESLHDSIPPQTNLTEFILGVVRKMARTIKQESSQTDIPTTVWIDTKSIPGGMSSIENWKSAIDCVKKRKSLIRTGYKIYKRWYKSNGGGDGGGDASAPISK